MKETYLQEAIKGDYKYGSEDRLSQIFAASFNHSQVFRHALADFLGDRRLGQSTCKTQQHYSAGKAKGRLDVVLLARSGTLQAVIENKVEAELKKHQTKTYDRFNEIGKRCRKGCVTVQAALAFAGRPNQ